MWFVISRRYFRYSMITPVKFLLKLYKYFFHNPLEILIINTAIKTKGNLFVLFFNMLSLMNKSKNRIIFKKKYYFNKEFNWRFSQQKQGIHVYSKGIKNRIQYLKNVYNISEINFETNDVIIDIGANNGDFFLCFEKKINYYGYEPSPGIFLNLKYNIANQHIYNLALSNKKDKQIDFYISDEFGDSSILPIKNFSEIVQVDTTTLDDEIFKIQKKIKLIKIEGEGYEPEILHGLSKYINEVEYITLDCGFERGIKKESTIESCSNYLIKNNFEMKKFDDARISALFRNINYKH